MFAKLKNIFFNKALKAHKIELNNNYIGSIPSHITYSEIKQALSAEDLGALIRIFEHFKRFDTQISSELNRRKMQVVRLPFLIESDDSAQKSFLENCCKSVDFRLFLQELSSAIAYGFAAFFMDFKPCKAKLYPSASLCKLMCGVGVFFALSQLFYSKYKNVKHFDFKKITQILASMVMSNFA